MYEQFSDPARKVMQLANQEAQRFNHEFIDTEHILLGLVKEGRGAAAQAIKNLDVDLRKIRLEVEKLVRSGPEMVTMGKLPQTLLTKKVVEYSMEEARNLNRSFVGTEHILLGLMREEKGIGGQVLRDLGLKLEDLRETILMMNILEDGPEPPAAKGIKTKTPAMDSFTVDLTKLAREESPRLKNWLIGRDTELTRIFRALEGAMDPNLLMIGEPGVGKTELIRSIAQSIVSYDCPPALRDKRICVLDLPMMIAGTKYRGQFEERWKALEFESKRVGNVILVIDDAYFGQFFQSEYRSVAAIKSLIAGALSNRSLQCILTTTPSSFVKYFAGEKELLSQFRKLEIAEPDLETTKLIVAAKANEIGSRYHVQVQPESVDAAVDLAQRFIHDCSFPKKALRVLDEACCRTRQLSSIIGPDVSEYDKFIAFLETELREAKEAGDPPEVIGEIRSQLDSLVEGRNGQVTSHELAVATASEAKTAFLDRKAKIESLIIEKEKAIENQDFEAATSLRDQFLLLEQQNRQHYFDARNYSITTELMLNPKNVAAMISEIEGIPLGWTSPGNAPAVQLKEFETHIGTNITGLQGVIGTIGKTLHSAYSRGPRESAPLCSTFLIGPAGVGKSLLVQRAYSSLFPNRKLPVFNLLNYRADELPLLTLDVYRALSARPNPHAIVFDHVEAATPAAWRLLKSVVETGQALAECGSMNFQNAFVFLIGRTKESSFVDDGLEGASDLKQDLSLAVEKLEYSFEQTFSPDFVATLDAIVDFCPLNRDSLARIVGNEVAVLTRELQMRNIKLNASAAVLASLSAKAQSEHFGAHNVRDMVRRNLEFPLIEYIGSYGFPAFQQVEAFIPEQSVETTIQFRKKRISQSSKAAP